MTGAPETGGFGRLLAEARPAAGEFVAFALGQSGYALRGAATLS